MPQSRCLPNPLLLSLGLAAALSASCGDTSDSRGDSLADARSGDGTEDGGADAGAAAAQWTRLIDGAWEIPPATEFYKCVRVTLKEDTFITGFKSIGPIGTHHTVLTVGAPSGPDGITTCSAGTNATQMIFGSGVGDIEFHFPRGVGVKIAKGQQVLLNLHLFNVTDTAITGTSGTEVILSSASEIEHEAESILMGKVSGLSVVPGDSEQVGTCTMTQDFTLLTVAPHMHQLGIHMKVEALLSTGSQMLHDDAYDFFDQKLFEIPALSVKKDDRIRITCGYRNTTGATVTFGDSSESEMCFAGIYRYPKAPPGRTGIVCIF